MGGNEGRARYRTVGGMLEEGGNESGTGRGMVGAWEARDKLGRGQVVNG